MDFITLWISALLSSRRRSALRMSLAAGVGALYGVLSVVFSIGGAFTYISAGAVSIIMCLCAFGTCGGVFSLLRQSALIWGCGALLGGIMTALLSLGGAGTDIYAPTGGALSLLAAVSVVMIYIIVRIICNVKNKRTVTVKVRFKNREISFSALCDSGNLMRDPISGDAVVPVSADIVTRLCGRAVAEALISLDSEALMNAGISIRLIPHRTEGSSGIIAGFVPDCVTVIAGARKKQVHCVLSPRECSKDYFAGCAATLPTSLLP